MDNQQIRLASWVELTGKLKRITQDESYVHVKVANTVLSFRQESVESEIIQKNLHKNMVGKEIGILFTDLPDKPIVIRTINMLDPSNVVPVEIQPDKDNAREPARLCERTKGH